MRVRAIGVLLGLLMSSVLRAQSGQLAADFTWSPSQPRVGQAVQLDPSTSTGNPNQFQWRTSNGLTSSEQRPTFTFATAGSYQVNLVVRRTGSTGDAISEATKTIVVSGDLQLNGPTAAQIGQAVELRARAEQCTPGAQGWVWQTDGGTVTGAANGSTLRVSWAAVGRKTVRVSHSACGNAAATRIVEVSNAPQPRITVNGPLRGRTHQSLRFTASAADCRPAANGWQWTTDGTITNHAGDNVSVTWTSPGVHRVTARNSGCGTATGETSIAIENAIPLSPNTPVRMDLPAQPAPRSVLFRADSVLSCPVQVVARTPGGEALANSVVSPTSTSTDLGFLPASGWGLELTSQCSQSVSVAIETLSDQQVPPSSCSGARRLCLLGGRFQAEVVWRDRSGNNGVGRPLPGSDQSGFFWFFEQENVELIVKMLDGRGSNGKFWAFYGALSDVAYWLRITDTNTGAVRTYVNPRGRICGLGDTSAFAGGAGGTGSSEAADAAELADALSLQPQADAFELAEDEETQPVFEALGSCVDNARTLCLQDKRFSVRVDWRRPAVGQSGFGTAVPGTDKTGYFWFFDAANLELVVKILDGVSNTGNFWVFYGALSNVAYTVTVTDTITGKVKIYENPEGNICGVGDTRALNPDPATIRITGPASAQTGQARSYTASVEKCDPIAGNWNWTTSGGTISGSATGNSITVSWPFGGSKTVTARNPGCGNARGTLSVGVEAAGAAPVADFAWSPLEPIAGQPTQLLDLSANLPTEWFWSFGDGQTSTLANPEHVFAAPGSYTVSLTVANQFGSHATSQTVIVREGASLPTPDFSWTPPTPTAGSNVQFSGSASNDPLSFSWDFGDGTTAAGPQVTHVFSAAGSYNVTLTVTNSAGSNSLTRTVTVVPPAGCQLQPVAVGQTASENWGADCLSTHFTDHYARYFTFSLGATTTVRIDLESVQDPYLFLLAGHGFNGTVIAQNDDFGGGLNSRIELSLPPGDYTIEATTFAPAATGAFTLTLVNLGGGGGGGGGASIVISGPDSGEMATYHTFTATASGCTPTANAWTWLDIYPNQPDTVSIAWGGPGNVTVTATNPGCPGVVGSKPFTLHEGPCFFALSLNQSYGNSWSSSCFSTHRTGSYARYYAFSVNSPTTVVFNLSSSDADPYLFLLQGWGQSGAVLASNDDSGGTLNSQLTFTLQPGNYTIEATTFSADDAGSFTLSTAQQ